MDRTLHSSATLRRMRLSLLLPLLLILSQHGAWLHELSHATYAAGAHHPAAEQAGVSFENGLCPSCQSFGQLGSALTSASPNLPDPTCAPAPRAEHHYAQPSADLPARRSRGPPLLV